MSEAKSSKEEKARDSVREEAVACFKKHENEFRCSLCQSTKHVQNPIETRQSGEALRRGRGAEVLRQRAARDRWGCVCLFVWKHEEEQEEESGAGNERERKCETEREWERSR